MSSRFVLSAALFVLSLPLAAVAGEPDILLPDPQTAAQRGYRNLVEKPYLTPDFDQETFDALWQHWPEPLRSLAENASPEERREMAFRRYGLTPRLDDSSKPLQYVVDEQGKWTMNCLACHGGVIPDGQDGGTVWPGAPNSQLALQTLTEDAMLAKEQLGKPPSRMDVGSAFIPLGSSNGTTNAVMFGVVLMGFRDSDLNFYLSRPIPKMTHHDMDAPAWWHFQRKKMLYIDGFAEKGHRGLMQFMLVRSNGPDKFRGWEADFRDVYAYISSIQPPKYPYPIDRDLAAAGEQAFSRVCADCHGTYGPGGSYPERLVPLAEVKTDPVRLKALTPAHRDAYGESWFADYGKLANLSDPGGYVAPPLDGVWASGPYFHNGSVPTLWHVLRPSERPAVWKRNAQVYDPQLVGPAIDTFEQLPAEVTDSAARRQFFNTRAFGKRATGHEFPDELTEDEKTAVLEYLKTL